MDIYDLKAFLKRNETSFQDYLGNYAFKDTLFEIEGLLLKTIQNTSNPDDVSSWGTDNGAGTIEIIFEISGRFYKVTGFYNSWEGSDFHGAVDNLREVAKKIRTIEYFE